MRCSGAVVSRSTRIDRAEGISLAATSAPVALAEIRKFLSKNDKTEMAPIL
jgi:hypothetical protein